MAREFGAPLVCVTLGAEGSLAWCDGREIRTPAFQVDCVDSTGAGDVFRGAFAAGCLAMPDGDIEDVLRYANAAAALNCRALGARGGLPTRGRGRAAADARPDCNFPEPTRSNRCGADRSVNAGVKRIDGTIAGVDAAGTAGEWP